MLRGIFGRTGGGKTLTLVSKLIWTLLETERMCVTNLQELNLARLNEYLQECREKEAKKHPSRARPPVDLDKRLLVIRKLDTRHFYRFRAGGLVLPEVNDKDKQGKPIGVDAFNEMMENYFDVVYTRKEWAIGVDYFMSECHRFFPARQYQEFAKPMGFYATQHRHLDDNAWLESQFPGQIDSNFRELVVEWYHVRNHGREVMGMFRQRAVFSWRMYYELPKGKAEPDDKGEFRLDAAGVASCYKTRGAISALANDKPEEQPKSKKLPFWCLPLFIIAGLVLAGCGLAMVPKIVEKGIGAVLGGVNAGAQKGLASTIPATSTPTAPVSEPAVDAPGVRVVALAAPVTPASAEVRVAGYVVSKANGGRLILTLTDGRIFTESDGVEIRIDRAGAIVDGKRYYFASVKRSDE